MIADHIRTLSFSIADGIEPGNTDRNYVLRRILRRAVRYGRTLGFKQPFFYKLVGVLTEAMGEVRKLGKVLGPLITEIPPKVGSRRPVDLARQAWLLRKLGRIER